MRLARWLPATVLIGVFACGRNTQVSLDGAECHEQQATESVLPSEAALQASSPEAIVAALECRRCHSVVELPGANPDKAIGEESGGASHSPQQTIGVLQAKDCVGCHAQTLDRDAALRDLHSVQDVVGDLPPSIHSFKINYLLFAPPLHHHGRLRRDWVARYLRRPHAVRPRLAGRMPRLPLSDAQVQILAEWLGTEDDDADEPLEVDEAQLATGKTLYLSQGCPSCHVYSTSLLSAEQAGSPAPQHLHYSKAAASAASPLVEARRAAVALAPELAHTRDRMTEESLVSWLEDPSRLAPGTEMPATRLPRDDLGALAHFILAAPLATRSPPPPPVAPPLLSRRVRWSEVEQKVFRASCWHCHADPDFAHGEGGPGNTGGFGYKGRQIVLADLISLRSGGVDREGQPQSLVSTKDGESLLVRSLLARHAEEAGRPVEGITGMPLGLPPLPMDDIALVRTWIAQGAKR